MARKLTKEELERNKADFAPPVDPGQTSLFDGKKEKKAATKKRPETKKAAISKKEPKREPIKEDDTVKEKPLPRHPGGRPGAFRGEVQAITLKLPPTDITKLKVLAAQQNKTAAQVIHDLLN